MIMYNFFLVLFVIVDVLLIFLIMIQNRTNSESNSSFGTVSNKQSLISFYNQNKLVYITSIFSCLFFVMSLLISNFNYHEHDKNQIIIHDKKVFSSIS